MIARGKREAKLNASPLVTNNNFEQSTESAKYQRKLFRSFRASRPLCVLNQGRRASRCSALAPGFHIPRLRRLPLAFIFRAFGACPWPSYSAPSALAPGLHIPRLWRLPLAFIFRAFGACPLAFIFRAFGACPLVFIFRAFGACPWLSYSAPSALALGLHIPRLRRWRKPPLALARHFDKERIDRDFHGRCVVDVEQRLCGPVCIALVDHTARKVLLTRCIAGGKDSVEVFPDSHQVSVVTQVRIEFELGYFGRCGG